MKSGQEGESCGLVWVKDGKIGIKDPGPGGSPARLTPCEGVYFLVSGKRVDGEIPVTESSEISLVFLNQEPSVSCAVQLTGDGLQAYLVIKAKDGVIYSLKDAEPAPHVRLEVDKKIVRPSLDYRDVLELVSSRGIVFGLDEGACKKACSELPQEPVLIARGQPATSGKDGSIEFAVPLERVVELPMDEVRVDFRDSVKIPDVKAGQVIAVKRMAVPGVPGKTVTGKAILPPKPIDPPLRAGRGVQLKQEGDLVMAIATVSGCPRFNEASGLLEVDQVFKHKGDVDLSSGNIRASGSVEVSGNVTEGMKVECEGNQEIWGTVTGASLKAWGSIVVKGSVFKSEVVAGKDVKWLRKWDSLTRNVEERIAVILEVEAQNRRLGEEEESTVPENPQAAHGEGAQETRSVALAGEIIDNSVLVEHFRQLLTALSDLYREDLSLLPKEVEEKVQTTRICLTSPGDLFQRVHCVEKEISAVRLWIEQELQKGQSDVIVRYVQSSNIEASRDIIVTGQGVFYCNLSAGRAVKVKGSPGLVRGGETVAAELIQVNEVGGYGPAVTVLRVSDRGKIVAGTVYPNTILSVGRLKVKTEHTLESVEVRMADGRLVIASKTGTIQVGG
ncbi:MAG TPA: DUF342 domain-containing protein [Firmicutes bacterium]|nr:DUF342 domain-containing protein [Candidatus Fermentithermobacillaceae bacterium]